MEEFRRISSKVPLPSTVNSTTLPYRQMTRYRERYLRLHFGRNKIDIGHGKRVPNFLSSFNLNLIANGSLKVRSSTELPDFSLLCRSREFHVDDKRLSSTMESGNLYEIIMSIVLRTFNDNTFDSDPWEEHE